MTSPYEKLECIGKGSFGEVYKGREHATGDIVAIKLVDLEKADEEIDVIQREIKVMSQISNPYVVKYHSSLMKGSTLWIVMEFMSGGSLKELVDAVGPLPEDAIATIMKALCKGLDYVHKGRKLHRDIKAANILLSDQGDVKLADFGVAGQMTTTVRQRNTFVGSPFWMAPEVIQESLYDEKADMWSMGITAIELANGLPPYATEHPYRALFLIPKNDPPRLDGPNFSRSFKDFVSLCLRKNPAERPSAEQLLAHSFIKKARSAAVKELLRQKESANAPDPKSDTVLIGGDSYTGSRPASSPNGSMGSAHARSADTLARWEFDFGSFNEDDAPSAAAAATATTTASDAPTPETATADTVPSTTKSVSAPTSKSVTPQTSSVLPSNAQTDSGLPSDRTGIESGANATAQSPPPVTTAASAPELGGPSRGEGSDVRTSRSQEDASGGGTGGVNAAISEVLTEVILPVISQIRGDLDAAGGDDTSLIRSLGMLEVAFVDVETTKPGFSDTLLRALLQEALRSKSPGVRALLASSLQGTSQNGPG